MKSPFLMAIAENMSMKNYAGKQTRSPIEYMGPVVSYWLLKLCPALFHSLAFLVQLTTPY